MTSWNGPFQSSPGPQTGCNAGSAMGVDALRRDVSILTRSADRVQRLASLGIRMKVVFQSSPGPQTGCNGASGPGFALKDAF